MGCWLPWIRSIFPFRELEMSAGGKGEGDSDMSPVASQNSWQGSMIAATLNATSS